MKLTTNEQIQILNNESMVVQYCIKSRALVYTMETLGDPFLHNIYNTDVRGFLFLTVYDTAGIGKLLNPDNSVEINTELKEGVSKKDLKRHTKAFKDLFKIGIDELEKNKQDGTLCLNQDEVMKTGWNRFMEHIDENHKALSRHLQETIMDEKLLDDILVLWKSFEDSTPLVEGDTTIITNDNIEDRDNNEPIDKLIIR